MMQAMADMKLQVASVVGSTGALVAIAFTPSEITALTIAASALLATIFAGIVNILVVMRRVNQVGVDVKEVKAQVVEVSSKSDVIAGHVNSAATKSAEQIAALQNELRLMREFAAEKKEVAAVLAQAAAGAPVTAASPKSTNADASLQRIDANTLETATNTKRTNATVDDVKVTVDDLKPK